MIRFIEVLLFSDFLKAVALKSGVNHGPVLLNLPENRAFFWKFSAAVPDF
jgi:hypothetical protein